MKIYMVWHTQLKSCIVYITMEGLTPLNIYSKMQLYFASTIKSLNKTGNENEMNRALGHLCAHIGYSQVFALRSNMVAMDLPDLNYHWGTSCYLLLKHTTTLFTLSDNYILSREWRVIVDQVQTNYHGRLMVVYPSDANDLLIMSDPHYGRMCFGSVQTLGVLHS